jgi:2-keto-4-pentenoate hydratase/2-oxohepta-3-ene-1,7-dioic acid hydratase in catechol pathway
MKILAINRTLNQPIDEAINHLSIIPDSAIIREGKPFFIPSFSQRWEYELTIAFRVTRLGKNIAAKFAHRYIDALALAVRNHPIDFEQAAAPSDITTAFDGAFIIGDWVEFESLDSMKSLSVEIDNKKISVEMSQLAIEETIALLSKYLTLKIGDIIAPATLSISGDITINTIIEGKLNDNTNIRLKFK